MTEPEVTKPAYLNLTEEGIKAALLEARGDVFIASQLLGVTALRVNRAITVSPLLQATIDSIRTVGKGVSPDDLNRAIESRLAFYRVVGLDELHALATMPIDANSAQNQVKLAAAARLAGPADGFGVSGEAAETLRALNDLYQQNAPRLRVIREKMTVEVLPAERVVSEQGSKS